MEIVFVLVFLLATTVGSDDLRVAKCDDQIVEEIRRDPVTADSLDPFPVVPCVGFRVDF